MGAVVIGRLIVCSGRIAIAAMLRGRHGFWRQILRGRIRREAGANELNRREQGGNQGQFAALEKGQRTLQS